ncbi:hypothetical protein H2202_002989 [Exophiala xenobiotica]|nr:hypothetical protein H2202_002989 [Exophiala xenobiotica]KAK5332037.1 hypothetical protein LTR93_001042 [Exophiala xenobiotica]KAK5385854.1 hypothetical protein LTS13_001489 [Exophiala xenobiotica]KAK5394193.1 hypothetical protein LTR79_008406 [Exophiala xenobiotica]KAK5413768.1 hypothetical protein LTR90_006406 [Exophiala xenobiotica]
MLHEILLSLSGLQSPIWTQTDAPKVKYAQGLNQYVSPPERAMLQSLAQLHDLHIQIKNATTRISREHPSMTCRAVSSSMSDVHLGRFMDKIIQVETSILKKDAGYVGAYEIVPLSTIVSDFAPWTRRLEWLWSIVRKMNHDSAGHQTKACAASILDLLEQETHTGYSDIQDMAFALLTVAQKAWMRAISVWVLYGKLPMSGADDFCIKQNLRSLSTMDTFLLDHSLVPKLVSPTGANALLSIGSALNQLRSQEVLAATSIKGLNDAAMALLPRHLRLLQSLRYPLNSALLENVFASINQSISENALAEILPRTLVLQMLQVTLRYLLLGHGEFAVSLVAHADDRISNRQQTQTAVRPVRRIGRLDDLAIKDAEIHAVLSKAMAEVAGLRIDEDTEDETFDFAKKILSLKPADAQDDPPMVSTLLPTPTLLVITIPPSSPLNIFLSTQDIKIYSLLNAYLLSIRRAGLHLSDLWKLTAHRRSYPTPLGPPRSASRAGQAALAARRSRDEYRTKRTRRHWTCASKALFMINELEGYLQGEVIQSSWSHLQRWLTGDDQNRPMSAKSSRPTTASSAGQTKMTDSSSGIPSSEKQAAPTDPRVLAQAHRAYLQALQSGLFLTDSVFVGALKTLLTQIDHLVALFSRLQKVWEGLDLQEDDGVVDAFSNYAQDSHEVLMEMDRTSDAINATIIELVDKVREVEKEKRSGIGHHALVEGLDSVELNASRFVPWQSRTVDRLVMKLDSLAARHEEDGDESEVVYDYDDE